LLSFHQSLSTHRFHPRTITTITPYSLILQRAPSRISTRLLSFHQSLSTHRFHPRTHSSSSIPFIRMKFRNVSTPRPPISVKLPSLQSTRSINPNRCLNFRHSYNSSGRRLYTNENKNPVRNVLMRQRRRWTLDDVFAMLSWLFVSQTLFIVLGTTTFCSLILFVINSLRFQGIFPYFNHE
jgi:hypothetical protein